MSYLRATLVGQRLASAVVTKTQLVRKPPFGGPTLSRGSLDEQEAPLSESYKTKELGQS